MSLPELLEKVTTSIWTELEETPAQDYTARQPMISSLRRNLQRQHVELLIALSGASLFNSASYKTIGDLVVEEQRQIKSKVDGLLTSSANRLDPYTRAHLKDVSLKIERALDADMIYGRM